MKTMAGVLILLAGLASCTTINSTPEDKSWERLEGSDVLVAQGYEKMVHESPACPNLSTVKGTVTKARVQEGRLVDAQGHFLNTPSERPPLCGSCVK
jgi:hypothetical protein